MDKEILSKLKEFLSQPEILELLKEKNFEEIYKRFSPSNSRLIGALTEICLKKNINPLLYMDYIPNYFLWDSKIAEFKIPQYITSIGEEAFENCMSLTRVTIPNSVTSVGDYAFDNCVSLTNITIPDSITSIGRGVFAVCGSLTSVTIPDSVTNIGDKAFYYCSKLTNITISDNVSSIGYDAFHCCPIETATIPASACRYINNIKLKTVVITGGTSVEYCALHDCTSLTSITLSDSIASIGQRAFYNCVSLADLYYMTGTKAQFADITKDKGWKSKVPKTCVVHCSDGDFPIMEFD